MALRARSLAAVVSALWIACPASPARGAGEAGAVSRKPPEIHAIVILPTAIDEAGAARPVRADDTDLGPLAQSLDALLADTAQDLGLSMGHPAPPGSAGAIRDADLLGRARAARAAVVLPSLRATSTGEVELRLTLAGPSASAVQVRGERVRRGDLSLRAVVLLRDIVSTPADDGGAALRLPVHDGGAAPRSPAPEEKLAGRVTLMANAAALGGLAGVSVQLASGSNDPRLLYPLALAGAGVGVGAAYLASGEWEVGTGDAWFWAAGAWWPTAAGHLIFQGRFAATRAESDRWVFGLVGSGVGASLATLGLALHPMTEGGALLAHEGGAAGMLLGAFVEMGVRRSAAQVPFSGMGYGTAVGWLAAATVAVQIRPSWPIKRAASGLPLLGVIGESRRGSASAPILGLGYAGALPF